ncbi:MAG: DUF2341 domain-containing protein [Candidatus Diapherotrites archaeon]|nr:DUF2341 domain-containing protein [Candidatus Diapherotrites archaeon]
MRGAACISALLFFAALLSSSAFAAGGTIHVIVTNESGDPIQGNIDIELLYRGTSVAQTQINGITTATFSVPHPGTYTVLAKWEYIKKEFCTLDNNWCQGLELGKIYGDSNDRPFDITIDQNLVVKRYYLESAAMVKTNVKLGKNDNARIALETNGDELWKQATILAKNQKSVPLWKAVRILGETKLKNEIEKKIPSKVISGTLEKNYAATFIVFFAGAVFDAYTNPEKDITETLHDAVPELIVTVSTDTAGYYLAEAVGFSGEEAIGPIGWGVAVLQIGYEFWKDEHRCANAETDDLEFIYGETTNKQVGSTIGYECGKEDSLGWHTNCPVTIVNLGEPLYDYRFVFNYSEILPRINYLEHGVTESGFSTLAFDPLSVAGGTYSIPLNAKLCDKSITLKLNRRLNPYAILEYPAVAYPNKAITIKAMVYSDDGVVETGGGQVSIRWKYAEESSYHIVTMQRVEGDKYRGRYSLDITPSKAGIIKFYLTAQDEMVDVLDTSLEEAEYEISVIDDAYSGADAPDTAPGVDISQYSNGATLLTGYLSAEPWDRIDTYRFQIQKGQKAPIFFAGDQALQISTGGALGNNNFKPTFSDLQKLADLTAQSTGTATLTISNPYSIDIRLLQYQFKVQVSGSPAENPVPGDTNQSKDTTPDTTKIDSYSGTVTQTRIVKIGGQSVIAGKVLTISSGSFTYSCAFNNSGKKIIKLDEVDFYGPILVNTAKSCIQKSGTTCKECYQGLYNERITKSGWYPYYSFFYVPVDHLQDGVIYDVWVEMTGTTITGTKKTITAKSQVVKIKISIDNPPVVNSISANIKYNSVDFNLGMADDKGLATAYIYKTNSATPLCTFSLGGATSKIVSCSWNTSGETQGTAYKVWAEIYDKGGNWTKSDELPITILSDVAPPVIEGLVALPTGSGGVFKNYAGGQVQLFASANDSGSGLREVKWSDNAAAIGSGTQISWNTLALAGAHTIKAEAWDNVGLRTEKTASITIDNIAPSLTVLSPYGSASIVDETDLNADASDSGSGLWKVEWFLLSGGTWQKIASGQKTKWFVGNISGDQAIKVVATDMVGNKAEQQVLVHVIGRPDLSPVSISFNPTEPIEGNGVEITVLLENSGERDAVDFNVGLLVDGVLIGTQPMSLAVGAQDSVLFNWASIAGNHFVMAIADTDYSILESDEYNNSITSDLAALERFKIIDSFSDGLKEEEMEFPSAGSVEKSVNISAGWGIIDANFLLSAHFDVEGDWVFGGYIQPQPNPEAEAPAAESQLVLEPKTVSNPPITFKYYEISKEIDIPLKSGWNMISIPLVMENTSIASVLSSIEGKYTAVQAHDAKTARWASYTPGEPVNSLNEIRPGLSYWISMQSDANLHLSGYQIFSWEISLYKGQNFVGYPSMTAREITEALSSIANKYSSVTHYENGGYQVYVPAYSGTASLHELGSGKGYWVEVTEDCTWVLADPDPQPTTGITDEPEATWAAYQYVGTKKPVLSALKPIENDFTAIYYYDADTGNWMRYYNPLNFTGGDWNASRIGWLLQGKWFDDLEHGKIYFVHFVSSPVAHALLWAADSCVYSNGYWYRSAIVNGGPDSKRCAQGCENSQCVAYDVAPPECTDSDNGDAAIKGTVEFKGQQFSDQCLSPELLLEFSCTESTLEAKVLKCQCINDSASFSSVSLDVGSNGSIEWSATNFSGSLLLDSGNTFPTIASEIGSYIQNNCAGQETCTVPLSFSVGSPGNLRISDFSILIERTDGSGGGGGGGGGGGLQGFEHKKTIAITEQSGSDLTDYQVPVKIDLDGLVAAGQLKADYSDIRFVDATEPTIEKTYLAYWIEPAQTVVPSPTPTPAPTQTPTPTPEENPHSGGSGSSGSGNTIPNPAPVSAPSSSSTPATLGTAQNSVSAEATIWVKIPSIEANSTKTIEMYYGNPEAESESDAEAVFDVFEDFSIDKGKWTEYDPEGKILQDYSGDQRLEFTDWKRYNPGYVAAPLSTNDFVLDYDLAITDDGGNAHSIGPGFADALGDMSAWMDGVAVLYYAGFDGTRFFEEAIINGNRIWSHGPAGSNSVDMGVGTTYYMRFEKYGGKLRLSAFSDPARTQLVGGSPKEITADFGSKTFNYFYLLAAAVSSPTGNWEWTSGWMDNVRVRKRAVVEPLVEFAFCCTISG